MIVKQKDAQPSNNVRAQAGQEAEEQMAFYLRRAFGERKDIYVFNDLRLVRIVDGMEEVGQIDHLIIHRAGMILIESKSVHGHIRINEHGEWSRTFGGRQHGMPSPIEQAKRQAKHLGRFLDDHAPEVAGKILGLIQAHFGALSVDVVVAVSDTGIVDRPGEKVLSLPEVRKADQVSIRVNELIALHRREMIGLTEPLRLMRGRDLSKSEMTNIVALLSAQHRPAQITPKEPVTVASSAPKARMAIPGSSAATLDETCNVCGKPLTPKVAQYCRDNEKRFGGRLLCYNHQRDRGVDDAPGSSA